MRAGIGIIGCVGAEVVGSSVSGADGGVEIIDSFDTRVVGGHFETRVGVKGRLIRGLSASGITHDDQMWRLRPSLLANLVRSAAHGDV